MKTDIRSKLLASLIQLIIGVVLLLFATWYLKDHPAEWQSIKTSVATVKQKAGDLRTRFGKGSGTALVEKQKKQLLSQLDEIITTIKSCSPETSVESYEQLYQMLIVTDAQDIIRDGSIYYSQMSEAYTHMQQLCKKQ